MASITRVSVTRCSNWWCHPIFFIFFWKNTDHLFSRPPQNLMTFTQVSSPLAPSPLSKWSFLKYSLQNWWAAKIVTFIRVSPPGWCHRGRSVPSASPSDVTDFATNRWAVKMRIRRRQHLCPTLDIVTCNWQRNDDRLACFPTLRRRRRALTSGIT